MREEIEELIQYMIALHEQIGRVKHPSTLRLEYARYKRRLRKLYDLQKQLTVLKIEALAESPQPPVVSSNYIHDIAPEDSRDV